MKNNNNIFWGLLLIVLGALFLLHNLHVIAFSFKGLWKFWPVILIYLGLSSIIKFSTQKTWPLLVIAILGVGTIVALLQVEPKSKNDENYSFDKEVQENETGNAKIFKFKEPFNKEVKTASLKIDFGAGKLRLNSNTVNLADAEVNSSLSGYNFTSEVVGNNANISFGMPNGNIDLKDDFENNAILNINKNVIWDISANTGASETYLNLEQNRVAKLSFETGASKSTIKLNNLNPITEVAIDAGVGEVEILIPQNAAAQIVKNSDLSTHNFEGFDKISSNLYQTKNFNTSPNKIQIVIDGGLASFKVKKY